MTFALALAVLLTLFAGFHLFLEFLLPRIWRLTRRSSSRAFTFTERQPRFASLFTWGRSRIDPWKAYLPVLAILAIGIVSTIWAGDGFLDLAEEMRRESPLLQQVDRDTYGWMHSHRDSGLTTLFTFFTILGTPVGLGILVGLISVLLVARKHPRWALYLIFTALGGALIDIQLKVYYARARPLLSEALRNAHGYSFPSGHAMGSLVVFGALSYVALRALPTWRAKSAALALALTFIVAICFSRIYLGVHWISDIAAGLAAGTVWLAVTTGAYETFRRIRRIQEAAPSQ